uniref:Uncharacterized protein n=1 Tax=Cyclopterus lumpus TaxID=8103 RepID=A0A8C2XH95_CYCLU
KHRHTHTHSHTHMSDQVTHRAKKVRRYWVISCGKRWINYLNYLSVMKMKYKFCRSTHRLTEHVLHAACIDPVLVSLHVHTFTHSHIHTCTYHDSRSGLRRHCDLEG